MIYKVLRKTVCNCHATSQPVCAHLPPAISVRPVLIPYERKSRRIIVCNLPPANAPEPRNPRRATLASRPPPPQPSPHAPRPLAPQPQPRGPRAPRVPGFPREPRTGAGRPPRPFCGLSFAKSIPLFPQQMREAKKLAHLAGTAKDWPSAGQPPAGLAPNGAKRPQKPPKGAKYSAHRSIFQKITSPESPPATVDKNGS